MTDGKKPNQELGKKGLSKKRKIEETSPYVSAVPESKVVSPETRPSDGNTIFIKYDSSEATEFKENLSSLEKKITALFESDKKEYIFSASDIENSALYIFGGKDRESKDVEARVHSRRQEYVAEKTLGFLKYIALETKDATKKENLIDHTTAAKYALRSLPQLIENLPEKNVQQWVNVGLGLIHFEDVQTKEGGEWKDLIPQFNVPHDEEYLKNFFAGDLGQEVYKRMFKNVNLELEKADVDLLEKQLLHSTSFGSLLLGLGLVVIGGVGGYGIRHLSDISNNSQSSVYEDCQKDLEDCKVQSATSKQRNKSLERQLDSATAPIVVSTISQDELDAYKSEKKELEAANAALAGYAADLRIAYADEREMNESCANAYDTLDEEHNVLLRMNIGNNTGNNTLDLESTCKGYESRFNQCQETLTGNNVYITRLEQELGTCANQPQEKCVVPSQYDKYNNFESQLAECIGALQEKRMAETRVEKKIVYRDRTNTKVVKEIVHEPAEGMPYIKEY